VEAHNGLGCALERLDQIEEAIRCFRQAISLDPTFATAHNNLGTALERQEKLEEALTSYEQAMSLKPDYAAARWNRARLWLLLGNFEQGWPEYEGRWTQTNTARRTFAQPLWDGSDLNGRTILLYAEQGLGDTMQFVRYAPLVKRSHESGVRAQGSGARSQHGRVIVECQPALMKLLAIVPGIDCLIEQGSPLPSFDCQASLGSLPGIFRTSVDTIPAAIPYLQADPKLVHKWTSDIRHRPSAFLVGICWQGNPAYGFDRQRSIPLSQFAPLAKLQGVRLISLQKGPGTEQLERMKDGSGRLKDEGGRMKIEEVADFSSSFIIHPSSFHIDEASGPFMDTAAIMRSLDLVITSDTAVAHLAGALGVATWLLLPLVPDWRWLLKREDSPWYPSMRLFRQMKDGCWEAIFQRVADALWGIISHRQVGNLPPH
jgi:hypothetical protein